MMKSRKRKEEVAGVLSVLTGGNLEMAAAYARDMGWLRAVLLSRGLRMALKIGGSVTSPKHEVSIFAACESFSEVTRDLSDEELEAIGEEALANRIVSMICIKLKKEMPTTLPVHVPSALYCETMKKARACEAEGEDPLASTSPLSAREKAAYRALNTFGSIDAPAGDVEGSCTIGDLVADDTRTVEGEALWSIIEGDHQKLDCLAVLEGFRKANPRATAERCAWEVAKIMDISIEESYEVIEGLRRLVA